MVHFIKVVKVDIQLFTIFCYFPFEVCGVYSDILSFIPDVGNLCLLFVLLEVYHFIIFSESQLFLFFFIDFFLLGNMFLSLNFIIFCSDFIIFSFACFGIIKMGSIKDRNGMDLTEAEDIKKRWQKYTEELYKKDLHDQDNHDGVITHLKPDILECEVKLTLENITTNKASGGDGIPVELFQILKDDAVKVLHSICQQI